MGFYQKKSRESDTSFLRVNPDTYARLVSENDDSYTLDITFSVTSESKNRKISEYEKVLITIARKEDNVDLSTYANATDFNDQRKESVVPLSGPRLSNGKVRPKYSEKVSNRIYSNIKLLEEIQRPEDTLEKSEVLLATYLEKSKRRRVFTTEIFSTLENKDISVLEKRGDRRFTFVDSLGRTQTEDERLALDVTNLVQRVNSSICDVTQPTHEEKYRSLDSKSILSNPQLKSSLSKTTRESFLFDLTRYYLTDIPSPPESKDIPTYEVRKVNKQIEEFEITSQIKLRKSNKNSNLVVKFELLRSGCSLTEESTFVDLYLSNYIEASKVINAPPDVSCHLSNISPGLQSHGNFLNCLTISDREVKNTIKSFSIYLKNVYQDGTTSSYKKIGDVTNTGVTSFNFYSESKLSIARVIPVDKDGNESNIFTNVVIGPGYDRINRLVIVPQNFGKNQVRVDVFNIPEETVVLTLYRRDCTDSYNSAFKFLTESRNDQGSKFATIVDDSTELDKIYEYYAVAVVVNQETYQEDAVISNFASIRNIIAGTVTKTVSVDIEKPVYSSDKDGPTASFFIKTTISPEENERITSTLKSLLGEMYEQYLSPSSNSSSPLGEDSKGIPRYSDLFFHQVVRNNLVTGERETFDLSSDGLFEDKRDTQKIFNISSLNRNHTYLYQVFTYKKNPVELFKKFVARGIDEKGSEWFYLPYKWKNPKIKIGKLYADDREGIPVIDAYDNFTSESFGITASHRLKGPDVFESSDRNVTFTRIDSKTVKVEWDSENLNSLDYDSFVVIKVVNGTRKILGRSRTNYIYHKLSEEDLGSVYYIVVPITSEFIVAYPRYSKYFTLSPDGISEKILLPQSDNDLILN